ncbi:MAG: hypothetical protein EOO39_10825 [Cytophagaceae bacterium]|nr:MAG: hypothetical protein EOO39_10825 [Cytophagaceae bacterium]
MVSPLDKTRLDSLAQSLGYKSASDFTRIQFSNVLNQKIAYRQAVVDRLTAKYGMTFDEFRQRVTNSSDSVLAQFGAIEKEDDDMEWELAIELIQDYSTELHLLA